MKPQKNQHFAKRSPLPDVAGSSFTPEKDRYKTGRIKIIHGRKPGGKSER
jgi:hypothetical protein